MARRVVRKLRHWKQRFDPTARFVFRRRCRFAGKQYQRGDEIPESLRKKRLKLEDFWEAGVIELLGWGELVGVHETLSLPMPEGVSIKHKGNHWYILTLPDGEEVKLQGRKRVEAWVAENG